jgi:hypothetical protein
MKGKSSLLHDDFIICLFYLIIDTQGFVWSITLTDTFSPFYVSILFGYFIDDLYWMSSFGITFSLYQSESTPSINVNWLVCVYSATTHQEKTMISDIIVCAKEYQTKMSEVRYYSIELYIIVIFENETLLNNCVMMWLNCIQLAKFGQFYENF